MKKLRELLFGVIAIVVIAPYTLAGCSETSQVEEKVIVDDGPAAVQPVTQPDDDVNVNVEVEGNKAPPQPVIIEKKEIINTTREVEPKIEPEKKIEVHNHYTTVNPPTESITTSGVTTTTTTTTGTQE